MISQLLQNKMKREAPDYIKDPKHTFSVLIPVFLIANCFQNKHMILFQRDTIFLISCPKILFCSCYCTFLNSCPVLSQTRENVSGWCKEFSGSIQITRHYIGTEGSIKVTSVGGRLSAFINHSWSISKPIKDHNSHLNPSKSSEYLHTSHCQRHSTGAYSILSLCIWKWKFSCQFYHQHKMISCGVDSCAGLPEK